MMHPDGVAGPEAVPSAQILPADQGPPVAVPTRGGRTWLIRGWNLAGGDPSPRCFAYTVLASAAVVILRPLGTQMSAPRAPAP